MIGLHRNRARVAIALLASCLLADAMAQFPATPGGGPAAPMTRYPWDRRAELCKPPSVPSGDQCNPDDWPTWAMTSQRVGYLFMIEQWGLLERALKELVPSTRVYPGGETAPSAVHWAIRAAMPAPGPQEAAQRKVAAWKDAYPDSEYLPLAQARLAYSTAWSVRGTGSASSVSKESWELFGIRLQEGEDFLLNAPAALKATPPWHQMLLVIAQDNPRGKSNADAVFETAVKRWPRYFDFYEARLTRMTPRWGGSWEQVESSIGGWSRQLSKTEGDSAYARFYASLRTQGITPEQTQANWPRMKASFDDLTARYPTPELKNLYASYACAARDKSAFTAALGKLASQELNQRIWLQGHSYDACMRWAGV
jgi:hypothetical protein